MKKEQKRKLVRVEITEMFMAQADEERCFYGSITRSRDERGNPHLFSRIMIDDGLIVSSSHNQKTLGKQLDEMCVMVLDKDIHKVDGEFIIVNLLDVEYSFYHREKFYLN
jgi:hypothetical protein